MKSRIRSVAVSARVIAIGAIAVKFDSYIAIGSKKRYRLACL